MQKKLTNYFFNNKFLSKEQPESIKILFLRYLYSIANAKRKTNYALNFHINIQSYPTKDYQIISSTHFNSTIRKTR